MDIQSTKVSEIKRTLDAQIQNSPPVAVEKPVIAPSAHIQKQTQEEIKTLTDDEEAALQQCLALSFLAYDPPKYICDTLTERGYSDIQFLSKFYTGAQSVCAVKDGRAFVVFRGSVSLLDWIMDFAFIPFFWPLQHLGFGLTWLSLRGDVRQWLANTTFDNVVLSGHSLGGAMAHLAAYSLSKNYNIVNVFTFGAPKAAFMGTAKRINNALIQGDKTRKLGDVIYCSVNQRDIVAKMPLALLGYRDVGHLIYINHSNQVFISEQAVSKRSDDSMSDLDFISDLLDTDKQSFITQDSHIIDKIKHWTKKTIFWCKHMWPGSEIIPISIALYFTTAGYFARSSLNHMTEQYIGVFFKERFTFQHMEPTKFGAFCSELKKLLFKVVAIGLFLWGLSEIIIFFWNSFSAAGDTQTS